MAKHLAPWISELQEAKANKRFDRFIQRNYRIGVMDMAKVAPVKRVTARVNGDNYLNVSADSSKLKALNNKPDDEAYESVASAALTALLVSALCFVIGLGVIAMNSGGFVKMITSMISEDPEAPTPSSAMYLLWVGIPLAFMIASGAVAWLAFDKAEKIRITFLEFQRTGIKELEESGAIYRITNEYSDELSKIIYLNDSLIRSSRILGTPTSKSGEAELLKTVQTFIEYMQVPAPQETYKRFWSEGQNRNTPEGRLAQLYADQLAIKKLAKGSLNSSFTTLIRYANRQEALAIEKGLKDKAKFAARAEV